MPLQPGQKLGPYEILAPLGAGGMGEVYRAMDTRLERVVAIKIVHSDAAMPGLQERLEREARAISKLSHPNVCAIFDIGTHEGVIFLVLEMVEGETLEQRLQSGPLPAQQTLRCAAQIADALARAHRIGIIHRDLKPANVMITKSGCKLLDFGLAKHVAELSFAGDEGSPTLEHTKLTGVGMLVGTFQYMAPEQLEGKEVDARTDIFSLGTLIYEMATGKTAFSGASKASLIANILTAQPPPIADVQPMTPPALDRAVRKCLAKDPDDRWQSASDLASELQWIADSGSQAGVVARQTVRKSWPEWAWWAVVSCLVLLAFGWVLFRKALPVATPASLEMVPENIAPIEGLSLSPDGRKLAFVMPDSRGIRMVWVRDLNSFTAKTVPGTEGANSVFWSPDNQTLGFFSRRKLTKISAEGGNAQILADNAYGFGASWNSDGVIVYTPYFYDGIYRTSAGGEKGAPLTRLDRARGEAAHVYAQFLPDGKHFIFLNRGGPADANTLTVRSLDSDTLTPLVQADTFVGYADPGYLLWVRRGSLLAQSFDPAKLEMRGEPFVVAEKVSYNADTAYTLATVSRSGTVAFLTESFAQQQFQVVDRAGKVLRNLGPPGPSTQFRSTRDGKRMVVSLADEGNGAYDLWVIDVERGTLTRITSSAVDETDPLFSPDGTRLVFSSDRHGMYDLYTRSASGIGEEAQLLHSDGDKFPGAWSPDGKYLIYMTYDPTKRRDIWVLPLEGDKVPRMLIGTNANETEPAISPDGNWMAYASTESGRFEVYLTSFPNPANKIQVSTTGGHNPHWSDDGKELFYGSDNKVMEVPVETSGGVRIGTPVTQFEMPKDSDGNFAVLKNGREFVVQTAVKRAAAEPIHVLLNWAAGLKK